MSTERLEEARKLLESIHHGVLGMDQAERHLHVTAAAIAAAEERGRRAGIAPALLERVLHVLAKVAAGQEDSWTSTIARGVEIELRKALAPRDSGKDTVLVLHPAQDGTCMYCHVAHFGICDAMNGQEDRK